MDRINIEPVRAEWDRMMAEYEGDNNHDHFQRDAAFAGEVRDNMAKLSPEMRQEFMDFLVSSLTSEFSGLCAVQRNPQERDQPRHQAADDLLGPRRIAPCRLHQLVFA
jgi:hypothetical protein